MANEFMQLCKTLVYRLYYNHNFSERLLRYLGSSVCTTALKSRSCTAPRSTLFSSLRWQGSRLGCRWLSGAGDEWPTRVFGIMSALLIALGLLPQYWEIWKRKEVVGISMLFMTTDMMGGVFSVLSLVFQAQFDAVAAVSYILVVVLDGVVVLAALILNPIAKRRRRREAEAAAATAATAGDLETGRSLHEGQIALAEAVAAVQSRQNSAQQMKEVDHD